MWPKLKFYGGLDQEKADNAEEKGGTGGVLVEFKDGRHYEVSFETPAALADWINRRTKDEGKPFTADPGLIILGKVTLKNMRLAVKELSEQGEFGFFTYMKEWTPERHEKYVAKYLKGMPKCEYEYPTAKED